MGAGSNLCLLLQVLIVVQLSPRISVIRIIKEQALEVKIAKPASAGKYSSVFDFCAGRCRHNSESVVHENAYRSEVHHCFSLPSNSSAAANYTFLEARLNGINVLVGRQGESCDSVCKSKGQSCVSNKLLVLNQCDIILEHACIPKHNPCFLVMVHISIQGGFALVHRKSSGTERKSKVGIRPC